MFSVDHDPILVHADSSKLSCLDRRLFTGLNLPNKEPVHHAISLVHMKQRSAEHTTVTHICISNSTYIYVWASGGVHENVHESAVVLRTEDHTNLVRIIQLWSDTIFFSEMAGMVPLERDNHVEVPRTRYISV